MTFGSIFAGIGGFDLGLERAGMAGRWQIEIDCDCTRVLSRHWPKVKRYGDITQISPADLPPVDLLCGGFPCQDLSVAGRRTGLVGARSGLFFEFLRFAAALRPRWLLIENVPGLLSSNGTEDMGTIVGALGKLGFWWAYRSLDAQYFGLAQRRERVFIVGHSGKRTAPVSVLFEPESVSGDSPPSRETRTELARDIAASLRGVGGDRRGWLNDAEQGLVVNALAYAALNDATNEEIVPTMGQNTGMATGRAGVIAHTLTAPHGSRYDGESETFVVHENLSGSLTPADHARSLRHGASHSYQFVAHTLRAEGADASEDGMGRGVPLAVEGMSIRRLTPTECERLQGFPDDWTAVDAQGKTISDSARYRMLGNAVAVPVAEWIGQQILKVEMGR